MVMSIRIEAFGEVEMDRTMLRWSAAAEDFRPAFNAIHETFLHLEADQFVSQGKYSPDGKWAPLAPSTERAKAAMGLDPRILYATENLVRSLTDSTDENHVYEVTPDSMFVGSSVEYGKYHQSREPRSKLPRRPPVAIPEKTKRLWVKILQEWLLEGRANARG